MSVKDRLKEYIKSQNITVRKFEESINVTNGYVNAISKSLGVDKLQAMIEIYSNLNIEWLLTGKGSMLRETETSGQLHSVSDNDKMIIELQTHRIKSLEKETRDLQKVVEELKKELSSANRREIRPKHV